jgi:hypothetical protein
LNVDHLWALVCGQNFPGVISLIWWDSLGKATVPAQHNPATDLVKRNGKIAGSKAKAESLSAPAVA